MDCRVARSDRRARRRSRAVRLREWPRPILEQERCLGSDAKTSVKTDIGGPRRFNVVRSDRQSLHLCLTLGRSYIEAQAETGRKSARVDAHASGSAGVCLAHLKSAREHRRVSTISWGTCTCPATFVSQSLPARTPIKWPSLCAHRRLHRLLRGPRRS